MSRHLPLIFFYFLKPFIVCPCCTGQHIDDRHTIDVLRCTGDEVAEVVLHVTHVSREYRVEDQQFLFLIKESFLTQHVLEPIRGENVLYIVLSSQT